MTLDRNDALQGSPVDVALDPVGGARPELRDAPAPRGRYLTSGAFAGPLAELDSRTRYLEDSI